VLKRCCGLLIGVQMCWGAAFALDSTQPDRIETRLRQPVQTYHLVADNLADGLMRVAEEFQIPMGIQWVNTPAAKSKLDRFWKDVTVRQILVSIANTQPNYEVTVSNGVVHVFSTTVTPNQNFLFIKIASFDAHHDVVGMAERKLRRLVQLATVPPTPGPAAGIGGSLAANVGEQKIDLRLSNTTAQDVLDALVLASPKKIWVVTFAEGSTPTATGFRRTLSFWNDSRPIPDDEQPVWSMFRWGERITRLASH
jgi:hypothetical protein